MKYRSFLYVIAVILIGFGIFGAITRQGYTDITRNENYMELLQVAEIPEELCIGSCKRLAALLPGAPIILRVTAAEKMENLFALSRQKVTVQEVYAGDGLAVGDDIYLISNSWSIVLESEEQSLQRGFVNTLKIGSDYLVFLLEQATTPLLTENIPTYCLYDENLIAPVFCYEDSENTILSTTGTTTYVPYAEVKDNEFFATTEAGLQAWLDLKDELLRSYPNSLH